MTHEYFAITSSLCYLACNIPLLRNVFRTRRVDLPWGFIVLVMCGQAFACLSVLTSEKNLGLLLNYVPGLLIFTTLCKIKLNPPNARS